MTTEPTSKKSDISHIKAEDQIKLNPWLIGLGVIALVVGILSGWVMSQATFIK